MVNPGDTVKFNQIPLVPEMIEGKAGQILALRYDISRVLAGQIGLDWQKDLTAAVLDNSTPKVIDANDATCREANPEQKSGMLVTPTEKIVRQFPILDSLYKGLLKEFMNQALPVSESIRTYPSFSAAANFISQLPPEDEDTEDEAIIRRMDAHVDERPTMVLIVSAPDSETTGRLVISNDADARNVEEINQAATYVVHKSGTAIAFPKGQILPHYAEPIKADDGPRIAASIDFLARNQSPDDPRLQEVSRRISPGMDDQARLT